jgi:hypothetical protein
LGAPPQVLARLKALRDAIAARSGDTPGHDADGKRETASLRASAAARAEAYAQERGININPPASALPMPTFMEVEP